MFKPSFFSIANQAPRILQATAVQTSPGSTVVLAPTVTSAADVTYQWKIGETIVGTDQQYSFTYTTLVDITLTCYNRFGNASITVRVSSLSWLNAAMYDFDASYGITAWPGTALVKQWLPRFGTTVLSSNASANAPTSRVVSGCSQVYFNNNRF